MAGVKSSLDTLRGTARRTRDVVALERAGRTARRKFCVVYGNCQAEPLRQLLAESPAFASEYVTVRVPAVHLITGRERARVARAMRNAALVVAHPVKDGFRRLGLGTREMTQGGAARVLRLPVLYYEGLLPYQVQIHAEDGSAIHGPIAGTGYHDLRALAAAHHDVRPEDLPDWLRSRQPSIQAIHAIAQRSLETLRTRQETCDIAVDDLVGSTIGTFWTVNHPSSSLLQATASRIVAEAGLGGDATKPAADRPEPLGDLRVGIDDAVSDALGVAGRRWRLDGVDRPAEAVLADHLRWYREHPEMARIAAGEHHDRLQMLSLR